MAEIDVYCHTSPSGRQYVGIASHGWRNRWSSHVWEARCGSACAFHRAIRKYGPSAFRHMVLATVETLDRAKAVERFLIAALGTYKNGYNATLGGDGVCGLVASKYARRRSSETHRGKILSDAHRAAVSAAFAGKPKSAEHRARISAAHQGKRMSDVARANMKAAWTRRDKVAAIAKLQAGRQAKRAKRGVSWA